VVVVASRTLLPVVQFGPGAELPGLVGKLVEGLQPKLGTGQSPMNPDRFTATFCDGRYSRELLDLRSGLKAIPIGAEGRR
jgi:hypothetical protein